MKKTILLAIIILIAVFIVWDYKRISEPIAEVNNFEECVAQGNPILESYPRQCMTADKRSFVRGY